MRLRMALLVLALLGALAPCAAAQEKPKADDAKPEALAAATPLKIQVIMSEYDGDRKIASLPYTFLVSAPAGTRAPRGTASIRMGVRVPVLTGGKEGSPQVQYVDVGTNIDCSARTLENGRYDLVLTVERSSVFSNAVIPDEKTAHAVSDDIRVSKEQPLIRQFRSALALLLRDGQTVESVMSTDPVTGRVLRVSVTLNVLK